MMAIQGERSCLNIHKTKKTAKRSVKISNEFYIRLAFGGLDCIVSDVVLMRDLLVERETALSREKIVKYAGIEVVDTLLVRDTVDFARSIHEPFLYNHVMRSWLFAVVLGGHMKALPDPELVAAAALLHDLGLTKKYAAEARFELDGANAARNFLQARGVVPQQIQLVWDAIALHAHGFIALYKEPEVWVIFEGVQDCFLSSLPALKNEKYSREQTGHLINNPGCGSNRARVARQYI